MQMKISQSPRGGTYEHARALYIAHPFISMSEIARVLKVSRQRIHACVKDLARERSGKVKAARRNLKGELC